MAYTHGYGEESRRTLYVDGYGTANFMQYHSQVVAGNTETMIKAALEEVTKAEKDLECSKEVKALEAAINKVVDIRNAEKYQEAIQKSEKMTTHNEMIIDTPENAWYLRHRKCSNRVYSYTDTIRALETKAKADRTGFITWEITGYEAEYWIFMETPISSRHCGSESVERIAMQKNKKYKTLAEAEKYLDGRFKAYSHLFKEEYPTIPSDKARYYEINGVLLPGYTVSEESEN